jgi:hypothetical protein
LKSDGKLLTEEDKSSIVGNPLTDRSTDLWKTFFNWIEALHSGVIDIERTKFVLYSNKSGRPGIVDMFSSAQNQSDAQSVLKYTKEVLGDIKPEHEIWSYYDFVVNKNEALLVKIVQRFELQIGNGAGYDDVRIEIQKKHVPEGQIEFIMDNLNGWIQKIFVENIADRKSAIISWEEFDRQFKVLFDRSRCRELIDFTMHYSKEHDNVQKQVNIRPLYLKQLEAIELTEEEVLEAVSDYLRADVNLEKWIEDAIIDEEIASDFEIRLTKFWENQRKRIKITQKKLEETEQGQLLLAECNSRMETIRDMTPPPSTIPGTYHALANQLILGWHPDWENLFSKKQEG